MTTIIELLQSSSTLVTCCLLGVAERLLWLQAASVHGASSTNLSIFSPAASSYSLLSKPCIQGLDMVALTHYLVETPFNAFVNRADNSCKSCLIRVYSVCLWKYDISNLTLVDLTSNLIVLCTNMKIYSYNYSKWKERVKSCGVQHMLDCQNMLARQCQRGS